MKPIIYLDMDGVLSDIEHGIHEKYGYRVDIHEEGEAGRSKFFKEFLPDYVAQGGFEHEVVCPNANELVDYLYKHYQDDTISLGILTSSGNFYQPNSEVVFQKKKFIEHNFPQLIEVPFCVTTAGKEKARLAHSKALLIDDHIKNCERFVLAGGDAFHYHPDELNFAIEAIDRFIRKSHMTSFERMFGGYDFQGLGTE